MSVEKWEQVHNSFLVAISDVRNAEEFLNLLFTPNERENFANRLRVLYALIRGDKTQEKIAGELGVSKGMVGKANRALKYEVPGAKKLLLDIEEILDL